MILYVCPTCGAWQDVSLLKALSDIFAGVAGAKTGTQQGYPCPAGHGFMVQVQPTDTLIVRPLIVEATTDDEYGRTLPALES